MRIDDIKTVCFAGAGTMGCFNSLTAAIAGYDVVLYDLSEETLSRVPERQQLLGAGMVDRWGISTESLESGLKRVRTTMDAAEAAGNADLLSESVFERLAIKRDVHRQFDRLCPPRTILTTNTSTLLVSQIEKAVSRGDRFAALHFHLMGKLVDITPGPRTDPRTIDVLQRFARSIGQIPILTRKENKGYLHNAMLVAWLKSGLGLVAEGIGSVQDVDRSWMIVNGTPGPFASMDSIGLNVALDIVQSEFDQTGSDALKRMVDLIRPYIDRGELGVKTGKGFYTYPDPEYVKEGFLKGE